MVVVVVVVVVVAVISFPLQPLVYITHVAVDCAVQTPRKKDLTPAKVNGKNSPD